MTFSKRLKEYRAIKNWRQEDLAKFSGVSLPSIRRYETGKESITTRNLQKIADALGVDPSQLLDNQTNSGALMREIELNNKAAPIGKKIRTIREENGITQKDFAKQFNLSYGTLQSYEYGKTTPNVDFLLALSETFNVSMDYFWDTNATPPSVQTPAKPAALALDLDQTQLQQIQDDQMYIVQLSHAVGAGKSVAIDGVDICDTDVLIPFSKMLFKTRLKSTETLRCMRVDGYSMVPLLYPDSWVIADVRASFDGDGLYIINYCGNFMVKLLQKSPDGTLHIKSVNKDYESFTVRAGDDTDVYIVGRVLRCVV